MSRFVADWMDAVPTSGAAPEDITTAFGAKCDASLAASPDFQSAFQ